MKILLVNTFDRGGAANACLRLHEGLLKSGIDSKVLLRNKQKNILQTYSASVKKKEYTFSQKVFLKIQKILKELKLIKVKKPITNDFLKKRDARLEMFSYPNSNYDITESPLYKEADIINLHWVANFLDFESFFKKNTKPVVWTLHDMNPFTGGEHFSEIIIGVDNIGNPIKRELKVFEIKEFNKVLKHKEALFKNVKNLHIVSLCNWMSDEVKESSFFNKFPTSLIPNGINSKIFKPRDKQYSRDFLNIPKDKKVILFVADSISNNRKGFIFLKRAFELLEDDNLVLCAIGNKNSNLESLNNIIELGSIHDERLMSIAYSAADVFVIPSLMDNLPNTVLESIMCGTPVIGFPVGGIPDMIQDGINGLLTQDISVSSLLNGINDFFKIKDQFDSKEIRLNALMNYDQTIQANKYKELFESLIK